MNGHITFLDAASSDPLRDVQDAVGESTTTIDGSRKAPVSTDGCSLSPPTVIEGHVS